jgi:hypothetical protein
MSKSIQELLDELKTIISELLARDLKECEMCDYKELFMENSPTHLIARIMSIQEIDELIIFREDHPYLKELQRITSDAPTLTPHFDTTKDLQ